MNENVFHNNWWFGFDLDQNVICPGSSLIIVPGCLYCTVRSWCCRDTRATGWWCSPAQFVSGDSPCCWSEIFLVPCVFWLLGCKWTVVLPFFGGVLWNVWTQSIIVCRIRGFSYILVCSCSNFLWKWLTGNAFLTFSKAIKSVPSSEEKSTVSKYAHHHFFWCLEGPVLRLAALHHLHTMEINALHRTVKLYRHLQDKIQADFLHVDFGFFSSQESQCWAHCSCTA